MERRGISRTCVVLCVLLMACVLSAGTSYAGWRTMYTLRPGPDGDGEDICGQEDRDVEEESVPWPNPSTGHHWSLVDETDGTGGTSETVDTDSVYEDNEVQDAFLAACDDNGQLDPQAAHRRYLTACGRFAAPYTTGVVTLEVWQLTSPIDTCVQVLGDSDGDRLEELATCVDSLGVTFYPGINFVEVTTTPIYGEFDPFDTGDGTVLRLIGRNGYTSGKVILDEIRVVYQEQI